MAEYEDIEHSPTPEPNLLFADGENQPLRFHIQNDLHPDLIETLTRIITECGGAVTTAIPLDGYVLIDPRSEKGKRMIDKWLDAARPDRHIISWSFIFGSVAKNALVSMERMKDIVPIFVKDDGLPVEIYVDPGIGEPRLLSVRSRIMLYGGMVAQVARKADVIVSDDSKPNFRVLKNKYDNRPERYVEPLVWVRECIQTKEYAHRAFIPTGTAKVSGLRPGTIRNNFTSLEDQCLVEYMAKSPETRAGNKMYKILCENPVRYPWGVTHTWMSWRNRYCKDKSRFDAAILKFQKEQRREGKSIASPLSAQAGPSSARKTKPPSKSSSKPARPPSPSGTDDLDLEYDRPSPTKNKRAANFDSDDEGQPAKGNKRARNDDVESDSSVDAMELMNRALGAQSSKTKQLIIPSKRPTTSGGHSSGFAVSSTLLGSGASSLKGKGKEKEVVEVMDNVDDDSDIRVVEDDEEHDAVEVVKSLSPPPPKVVKRGARKQAAVRPQKPPPSSRRVLTVEVPILIKKQPNPTQSQVPKQVKKQPEPTQSQVPKPVVVSHISDATSNDEDAEEAAALLDEPDAEEDEESSDEDKDEDEGSDEDKDEGSSQEGEDEAADDVVAEFAPGPQTQAFLDRDFTEPVRRSKRLKL